MLPSPAPSPPEPPPLDKMVAKALACALVSTKAKGGALAGPLIVHAAFGAVRFRDDALEERWANEQVKAVLQFAFMFSLAALAIHVFADEAVFQTVFMRALTTANVTIGVSL